MVPVELFSALTDSGTKADCLLLESGEPGALKSEKSILITQAALRIQVFSETFKIEALTANGKEFLCQFNSETCDLVEQSETIQSYHCPGCSSEFDMEARLKAINVFSPLREMLKQLQPADKSSAKAMMFSGLFGYDLVDSFEKLPEYKCQQINKQNDVAYPDIYLIIPETLIIIDHSHHSLKIEQLVISGIDKDEQIKRYNHASQQIAKLEQQILEAPTLKTIVPESNKDSVKLDCTDEEYAETVALCKRYIRQGEVFQIVPSRKFSVPCGNALSAYNRLSIQNPSPYQFYISSENFCLFGASPESAVKYDSESRIVELYPIAGTVPRGRNKDGSLNLDVDNRLECQLRLDSKELAEHMMLVDLARNDIARISETGTRRVAELLKVDRYSQVMHLVSRVEGKLRKDYDLFHAFQACLNMGTLTGSPKIRAMEILRETELSRRDYYGGSVGYFDVEGNLDTAIIIRSAIVNNGVAEIRAGAGIVFDSNPETETRETRLKASAVVKSISGELL